MIEKLRRLACLTLTGLLLWPGIPGQAEAMSLKDKGSRVKALKLRLFDLGYYQSIDDASDSYTADTQEKVSAFQAANGLPVTGQADDATQAAINRPDAVKAPLPADRPLYNTKPDHAPDLPEGIPARDEAGFLLEGPPYVYQNREKGLWLYLSQGMQVIVTRFCQAEGELEWFEAYITYREGGKPESIASLNGGERFQPPPKILEGREDIILAVTDDFFRYRERNNQRVGIVVRDGEVLSDRTYFQKRSRIPSLEVLAMFGDGGFKTFASDAHSAQEYLDMGVTDTWAFGPALVQEGEVPRYFYSEDYRSYREPRVAIGMAAPGSYCALVITGSKEGSRGAYFGWMAEKMLEMGAQEALNLDGGGTSAMVFMGEILNHSENKQNSRAVSGLIGFPAQ